MMIYQKLKNSDLIVQNTLLEYYKVLATCKSTNLSEINELLVLLDNASNQDGIATAT